MKMDCRRHLTLLRYNVFIFLNLEYRISQEEMIKRSQKHLNDLISIEIEEESISQWIMKCDLHIIQYTLKWNLHGDRRKQFHLTNIPTNTQFHYKAIK